MAGGGLVITVHKTWNPFGRDNKKKVIEDEEKDLKEKEEKLRRVEQAESEFRIHQLRVAAEERRKLLGLAPIPHENDGVKIQQNALETGPAPQEDHFAPAPAAVKGSIHDAAMAELTDEKGHINLFGDELFKTDGNVEHRKDVEADRQKMLRMKNMDPWQLGKVKGSKDVSEMWYNVADAKRELQDLRDKAVQNSIAQRESSDPMRRYYQEDELRKEQEDYEKKYKRQPKKSVPLPERPMSSEELLQKVLEQRDKLENKKPISYPESDEDDITTKSERKRQKAERKKRKEERKLQKGSKLDTAIKMAVEKKASEDRAGFVERLRAEREAREANEKLKTAQMLKKEGLINVMGNDEYKNTLRRMAPSPPPPRYSNRYNDVSRYNRDEPPSYRRNDRGNNGGARNSRDYRRDDREFRRDDDRECRRGDERGRGMRSDRGYGMRSDR